MRRDNYTTNDSLFLETRITPTAQYLLWSIYFRASEIGLLQGFHPGWFLHESVIINSQDGNLSHKLGQDGPETGKPSLQ